MTSLSPKRAVLNAIYRRTRARNPRFTLRAMATRLGVSHSLLSQVLSGKKPLAAKLALKLIECFPVEDSEKELLIGSKGISSVGSDGHRPRSDEIVSEDSPEFLTIRRPFQYTWFELAILDLVTLNSAEPNVLWIARKLGASIDRVTEAIQRLDCDGLLRVTEERIEKKFSKIYFDPGSTSEPIRAFHRESLRRALQELEDTSPERFAKRKIIGATVAVNRKHLSSIQQEMEKFLRRACEKLNRGETEDLYQLNLQLFPIAFGD